MCFKQKGTISILSGKPLILVGQLTYLGSKISSTESDINIRLAKAGNAIDRLLITWKSNLFGKIKQDYFQAVTVSTLLHECTTQTKTKHTKEKLYENYTRMLLAVLNKSGKQHPTKQQLYDHLSHHSSQTNKARRTLLECWRSKDKLTSDIHGRTPAH